MNLKHKLYAIVLALVLALNLAAQASGPITLQSAVASGKVEVNFSGTGASSGDSIRLKVKKTR